MADETRQVSTTEARKWIAAPWHTLTILLFFGCLILKDAHQASLSMATAGPVARSTLLRGYMLSIFFGVGMAYWCYGHWPAGNFVWGAGSVEEEFASKHDFACVVGCV